LSIFDKTGQSDSVTSGWRALELFTDRREAVRLFLTYLNEEPARESILFYFGEGGNGKSLLVRYLHRNHCRRRRALQFDGEGALGDVVVRSAYVDFGMPPRGEDRPLEAYSALLMLRRALSGGDLKFPLYDFAIVWYLHKTGKLTPDRLKSIFPSGEMDFVSSVVDAVSGTSYAAVSKAVLGLINNNYQERFTLFMKRRQLEEEEVLNIQRMDPETELVDYLPQLFAEDLNASMAAENAPPRVVLFFDTHDAFWGSERTLSNDLFFQRDEWLRRLIGTLNLSSGITVIVAGREPPKWVEAPKFTIPERYVERHWVGTLTSADADEYLQKAGVEDATLRESLIEFAQVLPQQSHPLYLGLCADIVLAAYAKGHAITSEEFRETPETVNKGLELINRLLRYVDAEMGYSVKALAACRAFNRDIYFELGRALKFRTTESDFNTLIQFSFVWRSARQDEGWYRIHDLLRRLLYEQGDQITLRAHEALEMYYRGLAEAGEESAVAEIIYHRNRLDKRRGVTEWGTNFDDALRSSRYGLCGALLDVRNELIIGDYFDKAIISEREGEYFHHLAKYREAEESYLNAVAHYSEALKDEPDLIPAYVNKATALRNYGGMLFTLSRYGEAIKAHEDAIATFDEVIKRDSTRASALNNKGIALRTLAELHGDLSEFEKARELLNQAVQVCDEGLLREPDLTNLLLTKGTALSSLGELEEKLSHHREAVNAYEESVTTLDSVIQRDADSLSAYNNKAATLVHLGGVLEELAEYGNAEESLKKAISAFDELLARAPDTIASYVNKGNAYRHLGDVVSKVKGIEESRGFYAQANVAYGEALRRAPGMVEALTNMAVVSRRLGQLDAAQNKLAEALRNLTDSVRLCNEALRLAPNSPPVYLNRGTAYIELGNYHAEIRQDEEASANFSRAVADFDYILVKVPRYVAAYVNKGNALKDYGVMLAKRLLYKDAVAKYAEAVRAYEEALQHAPSNVAAYNNKGYTLLAIGEAQEGSGASEAALRSYQAAIAAYNHALSLAPNELDALAGKATAFNNICTLLYNLNQHNEAARNGDKALAAYDELLKRDPRDYIALNDKSLVYMQLGSIRAMRGEFQNSLEIYTRALAALEQALGINPGYTLPLTNKGICLQQVGQLYLELSQVDSAVTSLLAARDVLHRILKLDRSDEQVRSKLVEVNNLLGHILGK
jgi:tetratricopeptide (TPR) repeat protein